MERVEIKKQTQRKKWAVESKWYWAIRRYKWGGRRRQKRKKERESELCVKRKNGRSKQRKGQKCEFYDSPLKKRTRPEKRKRETGSMLLTSSDGSLLLPRKSLDTSSILALAWRPWSKIFFWSVGGRTHVFSRVWITNFQSSFSNRFRTVLSQYCANRDNLPSKRSMSGAKMWSASAATSAWVRRAAWFWAEPGPLIWAKSELNSWTLFLIVGPKLLTGGG